ncbi:MAG: succinate dehydrogenase flavoprotein subunit [marine bacterium B5-7]|nr:MAG: succinate dehydrogenase flavoprotein subunit [marine bacterium B5-7]
MTITTYELDAVVVGGGGAGLRAALQLGASGRKVAVISKVFPTRSHTVAAQGGINAALGNHPEDGEDDWRWHMWDTVMGSDSMADQDAVEYMCKHAPATVYELEHMGLPFSRFDDGRIYQRAFGGQSRRFGKDLVHRTCAAADRTGHALLHTLYQQNVKAKTHFYHEWFALDVVKSGDHAVAGVLAMCIETGEVAFFKARATIMATGGAGRIYQSTTNAHINTGDGLGMMLRAGFPLQDMEMWQFHPTGVYGSGVLVTEGCRGEGGYLLNANGERFMERYAPVKKDLDCRDVVSRSSMMEILEGRGVGPNGDHVLLKIDHLGEDTINARLPSVRQIAITFAGVDPVKDPIPVLPTCHYMMGGIPTNFHGQALTINSKGEDVVIDGLYAAGECACVSVHGANRLGANSLLDIVVFGRAVGLHVVSALAEGLPQASHSQEDIDAAAARYSRWEDSTDGEPVHVIREEMQTIMQQSFGVFRNADQMKTGLEKLTSLRERLKHAVLTDKSKVFNTARVEALELDNLMETAFTTAVQANARTESRGAHSRYDYPDRDDKNWLKHVAVFSDGAMRDRAVNMQPNEVEAIPVEAREH